MRWSEGRSQSKEKTEVYMHVKILVATAPSPFISLSLVQLSHEWVFPFLSKARNFHVLASLFSLLPPFSIILLQTQKALLLFQYFQPRIRSLTHCSSLLITPSLRLPCSTNPLLLQIIKLMGGKSSREAGWRPRSNSSAWDSYHQSENLQSEYPQSYGQESYNYAPQQSFGSSQYYPSSTQEYGGDKRKLERRYSRIADDYKSLDQVTAALASAGLESSNLIVGIDFTKSNEWTGARSFSRRSLHHIGEGLNPYEQAISIIGKTLAAFDEDNLIPCFGFGDASTHDQDVFSFYPDDRSCHGFEEVLSRYREIVPNLRLAGPTSFAPIIEMAMTIVEQSRGQYHVLLIIADGQVTRSVDTERGHLSPQEQKTVEAIVAASKLPLSIVLVGVGDGPWDMMKEFDDNIPAREFDNFQFVNFTEIMSKHASTTRKETEFALAALMEIPSQYKATMELNLLGRRRGDIPERVALPPPMYGAASFSSSKPSQTSSFKTSVSSFQGDSQPASSAPPVTSSTYDNLVCPICLTNPKDMAFGCGHQTCCDCGESLPLCPICRSPIQTRIRLY